MPIVILLSLLHVTLFAAYTNCDFRNKEYVRICKNVRKKGVNIDYINRFLLQKPHIDHQTLRLLRPEKIGYHRRAEKRANNNLVRYIPNLKRHLGEYRKIYDIVEKRYGVNREIVAAILLKETRLGRIALKHDSFYVFDTLLRKLRDDTPRNRRLLAMARSNAAAIVEFCYTNGIEPQACRLPASYAGAVGIAQFMPSSFSYAVSSAPDRAPDLTDMKDAILSTANYLHKKAGFTKLLDWSKVGDMRAIEDAWYAYDFTRKNASFAYEKQNRRYYDCFTCKSKKFAYIRDYAKKIMRYNNASNYAVGVLRLAYEARR